MSPNTIKKLFDPSLGDEVVIDECLRGANMHSLTLACIHFTRTLKVGELSRLTTLSLLNCDMVHILLRHLSSVAVDLADVSVYSTRGVNDRMPSQEIARVLKLFEKLNIFRLGGYPSALVCELVGYLADMNTSLSTLQVEDPRPSGHCGDDDVGGGGSDNSARVTGHLFSHIARSMGANFSVRIVNNNGVDILQEYIRKLFHIKKFDDDKYHFHGCVCNLCNSYDYEEYDGGDGGLRNLFRVHPQ